MEKFYSTDKVPSADSRRVVRKYVHEVLATLSQARPGTSVVKCTIYLSYWHFSYMSIAPGSPTFEILIK